METKFKFNDEVRIIGTEIVGELVDIIPVGIFNGKPLYKYKMFTIDKGFIAVDESQLEYINIYKQENKDGNI